MSAIIFLFTRFATGLSHLMFFFLGKLAKVFVFLLKWLTSDHNVFITHKLQEMH